MLAQPSAIVASGITTLGSVSMPTVALPEADPDPVGTPTELYNRIARGATRCWFGADGGLKANYIFNASAEPGSKGGSAEIIIHEKDPRMPDPRGNRWFRVQIMAAGDSATVEVENIRFPTDVGQRMEREVRRWARDDMNCSPRVEAPQPAAIAPVAPQPAVAAQPAKTPTGVAPNVAPKPAPVR